MKKDLKRAQADLKQSVALSKIAEDSYVFLGYTYKDQSNIKEACKCWQKALTIWPGSDIAIEIETYCK
jgi:hypothetical protein